MDRRDATVTSGDVELAGSWWEPAAPIATLLMHPGSGPSDRDNDTYFPAIRDPLLTAGIAVASFDKRGVGGSTGRTGRTRGSPSRRRMSRRSVAHLAVRGATDADRPCSATAKAVGWWSRRRGEPTSAAFVITNSGPGVPPAVQDRFALVRAAEPRRA